MNLRVRLRIASLAAAAVATLATGGARADELSLGQAIEVARKKAPEIRGAKARVAQADAAIDVARAGYLPTVTALGTGNYVAEYQYNLTGNPRNPDQNVVAYTKNAIANGQLRWTVFDFGRTGNAVDAAKATLDQQKASYDDTDAQLVETATNFYLTAVYDDKLRDIAVLVLGQREKSLAVTQGLVKHGLLPPVEELRAQARLEAGKRDLETADGNAKDARAALLGFLGIEPTRSVTFTPPKLSRVLTDVSRAMHDAEEKRPAVLAAKQNVTSEEAQLEVAKSRYWPSINVNGDVIFRASNFDLPFGNAQDRQAIATVVLTVPIFDYSIGSRVDSAKGDLANAQATYDQTLRDAKTEAARAVVNMESDDRTRDHAKKAAEGSAGVLAVIQARFAQGLAGPLDLIEAEGEDTDARTSLVKAELNYEASIVRVLFAIGQIGKVSER